MLSPKIRSLLFQRPAADSSRRYSVRVSSDWGAVFRLQLSGQLQIPAAQVVQQAVSGGDVCVHCAGHIPLPAEPAAMSPEYSGRFACQAADSRRMSSVLRRKTARSLPGASVIQILQIGPDALFTYRYTDCFQRCCRLLTHRACSLHCSSPYQRNQHFEYVRGQSKTWSA